MFIYVENKYVHAWFALLLNLQPTVLAKLHDGLFIRLITNILVTGSHWKEVTNGPLAHFWFSE